MSDSEDNITPFRMPEKPQEDNRETFGERLRRRRREMSQGEDHTPLPERTWQSRTRTLFALVVESPHASASIARKNADEALSIPGVTKVLFSEHIPAFQNTLGEEFSGEPLLAEDRVFYQGQPVAVVIADSEETCRRAASQLDIDYHTDSGILSLDHALARESFHGSPRVCRRGESGVHLSKSKRRIEGFFSMPPQRVVAPAGQRITIRPDGDNSVSSSRGVLVEAASLYPTSVRTAVAKAAEIPESEVHIEPIDVPGLTGALELAPVRLAALATHAMRKCGCSISLFVASHHSILVSSERHEAHSGFRVGFDDDGKIEALELDLTLDGGWYVSDSTVSMDRALLHADGVYQIPHLRIRSRLAQTHRLVSASLPGEGSAQGSWAMDEVIQRVAIATGRSPKEVREKNFYEEESEIKTTPYGQSLQPSSIQRVWNQVLRRSNFEARRSELQTWNEESKTYKRGIAAVPIKFGVGDPRAERNAAAVIVQILPDGSVMVRAGLVRVNDGLTFQIREEVSRLLGIEEDAIRVILNDFDSLPRATPVTGTDAAGLVLRALSDACSALQKRLREVSLQLFAARGQTEIELEAIQFARGVVGSDIAPGSPLDFKEVVEGAWRKRVNLIETGYFRTPNLWWDPDLGGGWPFSAFTYAAVVVELQIDAFTGEIQILRLDVAHEGSPSPEQGERDFAQLMRAFQLGTCWHLSEHDEPTENRGPAATTRIETPGFADAPFEVVTDRLRPLGNPDTIPGDPCGEAPVLLAIAIREALRNALEGFGLDPKSEIALPFPATPPRTIATLKAISTQIREAEEKRSRKKK